MAKAKNVYTITKKGTQYCTVNKTSGNEIHCFKNRAGALKQLKALYASQGDTVGKDKASSSHIHCFEDDCDRQFLTEQAMLDHADAVHTFDDIRQIVGEALREKYAKPYTALSPSVYVWVSDMTTDWVVFSVENGNDCDLYKATYTLDSTGTQASIGTPQEVVRKTTYEPVPASEDDNQNDGDL